MKAKSSAHYQREYRRRLREQGLVKKEAWIRPENAELLAIVEKQLREPLESRQLDAIPVKGDDPMTTKMQAWTTTSLYIALQGTELFANRQASVELIEGIEPTLHMVMSEYGDLPIFLTVVGDQIVVESLLWAVSEVSDVPGLNDAVLRTHKYFPLSTISLDVMVDGTNYYQMFGALSSTSLLTNVVFEIETLAGNVIQATEAYGEFLSIPLQA